MPHLLHIRGEPGAGKITVGRLVAAETGWRLLWLHDLYRSAKTDPRRIDDLVAPALASLLDRGLDVVYVRPSRERESVERVRAAAARRPGYTFTVVHLTASHESLCQRVALREPSPYRISSASGLARYRGERPLEWWDGEHVVATDKLTAEDVKRRVLGILGAL